MARTSRRRTVLAALAVAFAFCMLWAGSASADSIFFLRDGNIWVANPDGSGQRQVTTDGGYDFVSTAKQGASPRLAFHRGGSSASAFGTLNPDGTGNAVNPANSQMFVGSSFFTRLDANGDRMTWPKPQNDNHAVFFADAVGVDGNNMLEEYRRDNMAAQNPTFGDPAGQSLLFTDVGIAYDFGGNSPCGGTDNYGSILVKTVPPAQSGSFHPSDGSFAIYCANDTLFFTPALSADGQRIAAEADSDAAGSSGGIVTIPIGGSVDSGSAQSPLTQVTPPNSGDTLPDFSPDGTRIAFQGPNNTILTVPSGGGAPSQILTNASTPAWSPYTIPAGGNGGQGGNGGGGGSVTVSSCHVPNLKGKKLAAAKKSITRAGCKVGKVRKKKSSKKNRGRVISQKPAAGKTVPRGTKVALVVGK